MGEDEEQLRLMALIFLRQDACRIWRGAGFSQIVSRVTAGTRPCAIQSNHFRIGMPEYFAASEIVTVQSNI